ncbi:LAFA_0C05270g1_1 [Lachancea sp. 'fantastica']|nr:LAFA_0C05270g1_1 [Lachancea sp. 'fantastica']
MSNDPFVDYSQLLSHLLTDEGDLNDGVVSFLYHLFPGDLFVRAMSLLDSRDMFIYLFDKAQGTCKHSESTETEPDRDPSLSTSHNSEDRVVKKGLEQNQRDFTPETTEPLYLQTAVDRKLDANSVQNETTNSRESTAPPSTSNVSSGIEEKNMVEALYDPAHKIMNRLVVKQNNEQTSPICVDLERWFCSCEEFNAQFLQNVVNCTSAGPTDQSTLYSRAVQDLDTKHSPPRSDRFAQLPHNPTDQVQRYFRHEMAMCPHLLAFGILLQTSTRILAYFTHTNMTVYLITVQNLDEWLNLHLNVVD